MVETTTHNLQQLHLLKEQHEDLLSASRQSVDVLQQGQQKVLTQQKELFDEQRGLQRSVAEVEQSVVHHKGTLMDAAQLLQAVIATLRSDIESSSSKLAVNSDQQVEAYRSSMEHITTLHYLTLELQRTINASTSSVARAGLQA